jgi:transketolase
MASVMKARSGKPPWRGSLELDKLIAIIDNGIQIDGRNKDVMNLDPSREVESFNWNVIKANGTILPVIKALELAKTVGKPTVIIAHTVKGERQFMENNPDFHGSSQCRGIEKA